jgi:hypothetical protein
MLNFFTDFFRLLQNKKVKNDIFFCFLNKFFITLHSQTNYFIMKSRIIYTLAIIFIFIHSVATFACTTIIISGKATKDGRPLMWKNTDTDISKLSVIHSDNKGYPLLAVVISAATDDKTASSWFGTNSEGFSIMNTLTYYPPCSVALPAWVKAGKDNPALLLRQPGQPNSKIGDMALALREDVYDVQKGQGQEYLNFAKVYNKQGTGYMQKLAPVENYVFETVNAALNKWREAGQLNKEEAKNLGKTISNYVEKNWPEK